MRNPFLCITIVGGLMLVALSSIGGLVWVAASGRETPVTAAVTTALVSLASGAAGALSSFLVMPPRGSIGAGNAGAERREP